MKETHRHERKPLTSGQIGRLLAAADQEWQGLILLGLDAGARLLDAANLRWSDLDMDRREVNFRVAKSAKLVTVPMTADLHGYFASLARPEAPEAPVFLSCFEIAQEYPGKLAMQFRYLQVNAGLVPVGFNCVRRTFIHSLMTLGVPENLVAQLMGHSDWRYEPAFPEAKTAAVAGLPRRVR